MNNRHTYCPYNPQYSQTVLQFLLILKDFFDNLVFLVCSDDMILAICWYTEVPQYRNLRNLSYDTTIKLSRKSETKLPGTVTWFDHMKYINSKIRKNMNLLRLCRPYICFEYAQIFYFQFIFCHLIQGICINHNRRFSMQLHQHFEAQNFSWNFPWFYLC